MSEFTQIFIDLSGLKVGQEETCLKGCGLKFVSSLLGTWLKGGVGRDLQEGVWIKGHDVQFDSDFLLIQGGVGRDSFKGVGIKGHEV